jgi:hypothetical protein
MTNEVSAELRKAQQHIVIAFGKLSKMGPGGNTTWIGAWCEYQKLGRLLARTQDLAARIERKEKLLNKRGISND